MCTFLSAIVMKNGDVLCDPEHTDSHEDLLAKHNIRDGLAQQGKFARVEFIPPKDHANIEDTSKWTFKVDEQVKPDWLDEERARSSLAARVKRMFVQDKRSILLGGCWILGDGADVAKVRNARIYGMYGSSKVGNMQDSSKVGWMYGSSKVGNMRDSSKVGEMYGSSEVGEMCDSSKIEVMCDSSKVGNMRDSSKVGEMYDSSKVEWMCGSSEVGEMCDSSKVEWMYGSSKVGNMQDSSKVGVMCDSSKVGEMYGSSKVGEMCDSSKVEWMYGSSKVSTWLLWSA